MDKNMNPILNTIDRNSAEAVALGYTLYTNDEFNILSDFLRINLGRKGGISSTLLQNTL